MSYNSGTAQPSLSNERVVDFDAITQADGGFVVDLSANTIQVPVDGWYDVSAHVRLTASVNTNMVLVVRDNATNADIVRSDQLTISQQELMLSASAYLTAGTVLRLGFYSTAATSIAGGGSGSFTFLHVVQLSAGPQGPTGPIGVTVQSTAPSSPYVGQIWAW